jgi:hypothetical protein
VELAATWLQFASCCPFGSALALACLAPHLTSVRSWYAPADPIISQCVVPHAGNSVRVSFF